MNPLMQSMNGATTSGGTSPQVFRLLSQLMQGRTPQQAFQSLLQSDPRFKAFMDANRGKSPEQVAQEHGINLNQFKGMM